MEQLADVCPLRNGCTKIYSDVDRLFRIRLGWILEGVRGHANAALRFLARFSFEPARLQRAHLAKKVRVRIMQMVFVDKIST